MEGVYFTIRKINPLPPSDPVLKYLILIVKNDFGPVITVWCWILCGLGIWR